MKKRRSPYNIDDVMKRDNCTQDEAIITINNLKNKTSGSLKSFVNRYGKTEGQKRYDEFCNKSANTKEKFKTKFGPEWEKEWSIYILSKDSMSEEFHKKKYGADWEVHYKNRLKSVSVGLEDFILRYGAVLGTEKFNEMNKARSYSCSTSGLIETFGVEKANKINKSKGQPGKLNPMFGKPSPIGSGNGISGWFYGEHFRSLLELSFMLYCKENNLILKTAETKEFRVKYLLNGVERTYCPDFVMCGDILELKPSSLLETEENKAKFKAAAKHFGKRFKILTELDFPSKVDLKILMNEHDIKLTKNWVNRI